MHNVFIAGGTGIRSFFRNPLPGYYPKNDTGETPIESVNYFV